MLVGPDDAALKRSLSILTAQGKLTLPAARRTAKGFCASTTFLGLAELNEFEFALLEHGLILTCST